MDLTQSTPKPVKQTSKYVDDTLFQYGKANSFLIFLCFTPLDVVVPVDYSYDDYDFIHVHHVCKSII